MNIDFKINDTVKIIGDIQGWTNRTGVIKSIHGVDFIVSCGSTEDYDILVMKREIEHYNPENESDDQHFYKYNFYKYIWSCE